MLQYILNCSAIWLLSLVCFDLFLRRSTFHTYNRFYLLGTMAAGIIVPLLSFRLGNEEYQPVLQNKAVYITLSAKENLIQSAGEVQTNMPNTINGLMILKVIYWAGLLFSFALLLRSSFQIFKLYHYGSKTVIDGFAVIETQQKHGPFSFFGTVFISDLSHYSPCQLSMIMAHENQHNKYYHSFDLLFAELCKMIFWFHPLPYLYKQRLLMVHEFQADEAVQQPIKEYSTFLVEQSLSQNTPTFSHSFFHSPLKKRILMLTRKSPTWAKSKMLIAIPVLAITLVCCSKKAVVSDNKRVQNGNKVTFRGNEFELKSYPNSATKVMNTTTGKMEEIVFEIVPYPIKLNGNTLLNTDSVDKKPETDKPMYVRIKEEFEENKPLFNQLTDGTYYIDVIHFVTDEDGKVIYYKYDGIYNGQNIQLPGSQEWVQQKVQPENVKNKIDEMIATLANNIKFSPARKNGKAVACFTEYGVGAPFIFTVKNHNATVGRTSIPAGEYKIVHQGDNDTTEVMNVQVK